MATQQEPRELHPLSSDVERAERADAAGAHSDAITHLSAGVRKHDVEAMTRLGKRLLVGDRAPCLPKDGAGLVAEASGRGGAEAAAVLAVLYAVGASRGHDVHAGLQSLIVAAERGWASARAQLHVLAAGPTSSEDLGAARASEVADWRALGQRVDLAAWLSAPASTDLSVSPLVRSHLEFTSAPMCRWFIERARGRLSR